MASEDKPVHIADIERSMREIFSLALDPINRELVGHQQPSVKKVFHEMEEHLEQWMANPTAHWAAIAVYLAWWERLWQVESDRDKEDDGARELFNRVSRLNRVLWRQPEIVEALPTIQKVLRPRRTRERELRH